MAIFRQHPVADDPLGTTTFDLLRWFNGQLAALLAIG
jgi:hypothetical protein